MKKLISVFILVSSANIYAESPNIAELIFTSLGSATPLLFKIYNLGLIACLTAVGMGTVFYGGALAAADGSGIARKLNTWAIVRTIGGAALLVPYGNGYALIQKFVMSVAISSVVVANTFLTNLSSNFINIGSGAQVYPAEHTSELKQQNSIQDTFKSIQKLAIAAAIRGENNGESIRTLCDNATSSCYYVVGNESVTDSPFYVTITNPSESAANIPLLQRAMAAAYSGARSLPNDLQARISEVFETRLAEAVVNTGGQGSNAAEEAIVALVGDGEVGSSSSTGVIQTITKQKFSAKTAEGYQIDTENCSGASQYCWNNSVYQQTFMPIVSLFTKLIPNCVTEAGGQCASLNLVSKDEGLSFELLFAHLPTIVQQVVVSGAATTASNDSDSVKRALTAALSKVTLFVSPVTADSLGNNSSQVPYYTAGNTSGNVAQFTSTNNPYTSACTQEDETAKYNCMRDKFYSLLRYNILSQIYEKHVNSTIIEGKDVTTAAVVDDTDVSAVANKITGYQRLILSGLIPREGAASSYLRNKNKVPEEIDQMLLTVVESITGCSSIRCNQTTGMVNFNRYPQNINAVKLVRDAGLGILEAGLTYLKDAIRAENVGIIAQEDHIEEQVYGGQSAALGIGRGVTAGLQSLGPLNAHMRGLTAATSAGIGVSMDTIGFLADLDQLMLYKYEPLGAALSSLFMIWGAFFSIFLPMVPFMVVMFSLIGWVLLVSEAFLATPLIALGLAHPSSQQFLGASDQVLMMLLQVWLRPLLITVAIIFACIISYVGIYFLNEGIFIFINELDNASGAGFAVFFATLMVYAYLAFMIIIQAYSLVGSLPDTVSRWIGMGPLGGTSPLQQLLSIRSSFESGVQASAQGASRMGAQVKQSMGSHTSMNMSHAIMAKDAFRSFTYKDQDENSDKIQIDENTFKGADKDFSKVIRDDERLSLQAKNRIINALRHDRRGFTSRIGGTRMKAQTQYEHELEHVGAGNKPRFLYTQSGQSREAQKQRQNIHKSGPRIVGNNMIDMLAQPLYNVNRNIAPNSGYIATGFHYATAFVQTAAKIPFVLGYGLMALGPESVSQALLQRNERLNQN